MFLGHFPSPKSWSSYGPHPGSWGGEFWGTSGWGETLGRVNVYGLIGNYREGLWGEGQDHCWGPGWVWDGIWGKAWGTPHFWSFLVILAQNVWVFGCNFWLVAKRLSVFIQL